MEDNNEEIKKNDTIESTDTDGTTQKPRTTRKKKVTVNVLSTKIDLNGLSSGAKEGLCNNIHEWKRSGSLNVKLRTAMLKNLGLDIQGWSRSYSISEFIKAMEEIGAKLECSDEHGKPCCS